MTKSVGIKPIKTEADYRTALKEIESLMTAKANSPEGDRLDVLTTLVEAYELTCTLHRTTDLDRPQTTRSRHSLGYHLFVE